MHSTLADLMIGGSRLRRLYCELEREERHENREDWLLSGRISLPLEDEKLVHTDRRYLLQLEDGREGLIELTSLESVDHHLEADFRPLAVKPR